MKRVTNFLILSCLLICSADAAFSQCAGTHFNNVYQKIAGSNGLRRVEDWTGDGKPDIWRFALNSATSTLDVHIYPNDGNGQFDWNNPIISPTTIPAGFPGDDAYRIFDFNNDTKKDIFYSYDGFTRIHLNNGNNTFTPLALVSFPDEFTFLGTIGFIDVNSDNLLDWIRWNSVPSQGSALTYRLGRADGTFGPRVDIVVNGSLRPSSRLIADYTGDGRMDIGYRYFDGGDRFRVLINNGNGTFSFGPVTNDYPPNEPIPTATDLNNDGKSDLVVGYLVNINLRQLAVYRNNGDASFTRVELPRFRPEHASVKIAEFNGDNAVDIIEIGDKFYSVYSNNGAGAFTRSDYQKQLGQPESIVFADFNNDNKADLYRLSQEGGSFIGNIFGEQIVVIEYNQCQPMGLTKYANFDIKRFADLIMWNPDTGDWASTSAAGYRFYTEVTDFNWGRGTFGDVPSPGDYDGDGTTDYVVYRNSNGTWHILQSSNSGGSVVPFGLPGDIPVPADYNGGGKTDIAVFRPSDGNWHIWFTETQQYYSVHFGASGDRPVPEDYDGDRKADIAVYRPNEGNWYYLRSSDQTFVGLHWGIATDKPMPADYDGDLKADIAVFRDGDWYILRSSNNSFNFIRWGISSDVPLPVYSNNVSASPVAYRASQWNWYKYHPIYSSDTVAFGANGSRPVIFGQPNN